MKILSLWQPWASLWVAGLKGPETRSWGTQYRGIISVHAAKHWDESLAALCRSEPFRSALESIGFTDMPMGHRQSLPFGKILGYVDLTDCLKMVGGDGLGLPGGFISLADDPRLTPTVRAFGNYAPGRFAWVTGTQRKILAEPIPHRGGQGLRDLDPEIAARLA